MLTIHVSGMQCASCVASLQRVLPESAGPAQIDLERGTVVLQDASQAVEAECCRAIAEAGFSVQGVERED